MSKQARLGLVAVLAMPLLLLLLMSSPVHAQLDPVTWSESIQLDAAPGPDDIKVGADDNAPDPIPGLVTGPGYSLTGSISFTSPGPPNMTATVTADYQDGDLIDLAVIEFAAGYWALGRTPVEDATWGTIKKLYRQ